MAVRVGIDCRVFIGDMDISHLVRSVEIHANAGHTVISHLELLDMPVITPEGQIRFNYPPQAAVGPLIVDGRRIRAIMIREDEDDETDL